MRDDSSCKCGFCKNKLEFKFPEHLLNEFEAGNVVVFAGAGISTENRDYAGDTFYERIAREIGESRTLSFPQLCQEYCARPDGRIKLIERIIDRFRYFKSFDDFFRAMTGFHRALTPLFTVTDVITTNWDDFFESVVGFDAFVSDNDLPFWNASQRRVLKIHGSIRNLGSIVATEDDYTRSFHRLNEGPMGAMLKMLLSQKTILYVGYSLSDDNYLRLASDIAVMLKPHIKTSYIVAPEISDEKIVSFPLPLVPIKTDGAYLLEQLRIHLEDKVGIVRDEALDLCDSLLEEVVEAHERTVSAFFATKHPLTPFALSYQDGLIHGLKRIKARRSTGEYHSRQHLYNLVRGYDKKTKEYKALGDFWNVNYANGYQDAIIYLIACDEEKSSPRFPLYGVYGTDSFYSISALTRFRRSDVKPKHQRQAQKIFVRCLSEDRRLIPDHVPYL